MRNEFQRKKDIAKLEEMIENLKSLLSFDNRLGVAGFK
jgi:hypothetical protein